MDEAFILGIVEGLTEFLPVSSTGHLIIGGDYLSFNDEHGKVFEIIIQLGAILGVLWDYRNRVRRLITGWREKHEQRFALNLLNAFLPAAIVGVLFRHHITTHLFNPITVAWALVVLSEGTGRVVAVDAGGNALMLDSGSAARRA